MTLECDPSRWAINSVIIILWVIINIMAFVMSIGFVSTLTKWPWGPYFPDKKSN